MNMTPQTALQKAETLMLDMDGTLLDLAFDNFMWQQHVPRQYAIANDMSFEDALADLMGRYESVHGSLEWYCLDHWCDRLGIDVVQMHHDMSHLIGYLPGALEFLRQVHTQDVKVLLVTNAHPDTLALKDAITGLGDYFDGLHSSHTYGHAKESQDFWHALHDEVGFDVETTLFVDDAQRVLRSARDYGVEMLVTVTRPDTSRPALSGSEFKGVEAVADLIGARP